jgi:acetamidase/formamidase
VGFPQEQFGLSTVDAYSLASIAVDFRVAEAVDPVEMIYGMIPKKLFRKNPEYWVR